MKSLAKFNPSGGRLKINSFSRFAIYRCIYLLLLILGRRLSDAAGVDSECGGTAGTNSSLSDEGTPVTATPPSAEQPITAQGEKTDRRIVTRHDLAAPHCPAMVFFCCVFPPVDAVDASLPSDLSADLLGLEVESWSLAVSPEFCKQHDRRTVKRQDVIYGGEALPHTHIHTQHYICPLHGAHCACNYTFRPLSAIL